MLLVALAAVFACAQAAVAAASSEATELRFRDFFKMPVGPLGLEASTRLISLEGQLVRIRGYVVRQAEPIPGVLILSPLPIELGDADEGLSDDLPPAVVFVHLDAPTPDAVGLVQVTGTLEVGPRDETDGHVSQVRLRASPAQVASIAQIPVPATASSAPSQSQ